MTYRVIIEPTAEIEIRQAVRWLAANRSHTVAVRWLGGIQTKIQTLRKLPLRCPLAAENDKFPEDIRELLFGKAKNRYRIIFTVRNDAVHVLYVRHGAQDELQP